ncbi:tRNA lysidine(34) synthetase TilS [Pistricoccus aurantiacus]|uniref:tRNA lysidine(34) synthetase TilS n=1 Tax=Pistricoccus aurantiacus TaxID=1883414 RepID=UPI0036341F0A
MSPQSLIDNALAATPPGRVVWVALSGGLDSCLLLSLACDAARRFPRPIHALHVNHGLQRAADGFENHCRRLCSRLGVPLFIERVRIDPQAGLGLEGAAREARYSAFARRVEPGETLWLGQHASDQAETFLLAALRGSGVRGLAAMPKTRDWRGRRLQRPLLALTRRRLERDAVRRELQWVEDPSNDDLSLDRNFLRHGVMAQLRTRWPQAETSLARAATLVGEADALLEELAELDLASVGGNPAELPLAMLAALSPARQRLLIRHCCRRLELATPPVRRLEALLEQLAARRDARVCIAWPGKAALDAEASDAEARLWRGHLYLHASSVSLDAAWQSCWDGKRSIETPFGHLSGSLERDDGGSVAVTLAPRRGGERMMLAERGSRDLKRLLQEASVPPWRRNQLLLAFDRETLVAVLDPLEETTLYQAPGWRVRNIRVLKR